MTCSPDGRAGRVNSGKEHRNCDLSDGVRRLFDGTNFAVLTTLEPDGRPHSTVVWTKRDGDDIVFALPKNRRKTANLNRDPRATVVVFDAANPYESAQVQGIACVEDDPDGLLVERKIVASATTTITSCWPRQRPSFGADALDDWVDGVLAIASMTRGCETSLSRPSWRGVLRAADVGQGGAPAPKRGRTTMTKPRAGAWAG